MSGAGKMGDRGGGRESTKSLNKSKQTKHKIETDQKKAREQYLLTRPKFSPPPASITLPAAEENLVPMLDVSAHLLSRTFNRDIIAVMRRAKEAGVIGCVLQCDWTRVTELMSLVKQWPGQMFATVGISPDLIKKNNDSLFAARMEQLLDLALQKDVVAVSCGLDLTRDLGTHFLQDKLFAAQVALAKQVRLPVIVWEKAACEQVCTALRTLKDTLDAKDAPAASPAASSHPHGKPDPIVISTSSSSANPFPKVAIHGFNGSQGDLEKYLANDCYIVVNGIVCDVKAVGEAAASSVASKEDVKAKQRRDEEAKNDAEDAEEDVAEEHEDETEESDGSGFKAAALVGPPDLTGSGAHLFHLIRSGLLPLDRLMVSTDAPLHTPQNINDFYIRSSRNEPSNIHHIFLMLAKAYGLPVEEVQAKVFATSKSFFALLNQAEAAIEEEKAGERERAKQIEEKKLLDREKRKEAEEKAKARAAAAAVEEAATQGRETGKQKGKAFYVAQQKLTSTAGSDDEDDAKKKGKKGGKQKGGAAPQLASKGKNATAASDDSDEEWGKIKNKKQAKKQAKAKQKAQKKRTGDSDEEEESDEDEEEEAPKSKANKPVAKKAPAKGKKDESEDEESSESESEEEAPKPAKKAAPAKKPTKKAESSSEESESEGEEEEAPAPKKKPAPAKKAAKKAESSSSESESESEEETKPAGKKNGGKKKAALSSSSESETSDSDSEPETKRSAETIAASKRARAAAIKEKQEATKNARKQGDLPTKKPKAKGKAAVGDEEVDELDQLFMAQSISGLDAAAAEAAKKLEASKAAAAAARAANAQPDEQEEELVQFRCRRCQAKLFTNRDEIGHDETASVASAKEYSPCEQIFIERPSWLAQDAIDEAKAAPAPIDLLCYKCNARLGRISQTPLMCACGRPGAGSSPYVSVKSSRLDAVSLSAALIKGPRAVDVSELEKARADADEEYERSRREEKERLRAKDKAKKASLMPTTNQIGNFNQFRNKSLGAVAEKSAVKKKSKAAKSTAEDD